jgi:hypothetical protein
VRSFVGGLSGGIPGAVFRPLVAGQFVDGMHAAVGGEIPR